MRPPALFAFAAALFLVSCRSTVPLEQDCPLRIRLSSTLFANSGLVRPTFEGLREIDGSFEIRRIEVASTPLPATQRRRRERGTRPRYPLALGMPETAWRSIGRQIDEQAYAVDPRSYQIVVRYRALVSNATCVAGSDAFIIETGSLWVVTN